MSLELNEAKSKCYTITIDPTSQKVKPKNEYKFGIISNNINKVVSVTIDEFIKSVSSPLSFTWFGGTSKGYPINSENWESQSIFAIDFDNGLISVEEAIQRLKSVEINPQVWYQTLSDSEKLRKFRIVIFLDNPITKPELHEHISTGLLTLFPEADQSCKNRNRFYLGGKQAFILDHIPNSTQKVIDILATIIMSSDGGRTRKIPRDIAPLHSTNTGENRYFLYNRYRNYQNKPKLTISVQGGKDSTRIDWELASRKVRILNEFLNGTWLTHNQLLGLATNLILIRGGQKLMNETMQKFNEEGKTNYTSNNLAILSYIKKVNYYPQLIKNFSPYTEDADLYDIVSATIEVRGQIEKIEEINKIPLKDAETLFKSNFDRVLNEGVSGKIYLFKLPTSIGKTTSITSCVATTIATPTNDLKNEISTRMEIEHECSPDEVIFESEELNRKLIYYYSIGLPKKAIAVIHDVVNGTGLVLNSQSDSDTANKYLNQLEKSKHCKTTVLTTHARALHTEYSNDTLIFDEEPLNSMVAIKTMEISDLVKIKNNIKNSKDSLGYIIDYLESVNPGEIVQTPLLIVDLDELVKNSSYTRIDTNVFGFFDSCYLYKDIHSPNTIYYVVKKELPKDKKVIIMSATIPIYLYQKIYGDRVEVIDISDVQQMGSITQYTQRSCSRNGLNSYHQIISEMVGEKPVITFKSFQNQFKNPVCNMYFGNCSGYDSLKGKDIAVVGTPHRDVVQYFLIARVLGIEIKITDSTMSHQKIEYNGFKFMFCCFDNKELRNIQLSLIESDLIQAVGRARTLRTNAKVEVYSNFPLRISNYFEY